MKFVNKDTGLELLISNELINRLAAYGKEKYPNEFGGLLLGKYINNKKTVVIKETLLPKKFRSSRYYFERGSNGLKEQLEQYYANEDLVYVGEWHTHPDNVAVPSQTDLKSMRELAEDENVLINNPVLMILEIQKADYDIGIYFLFNGKLLRYIWAESE
ncbi:Mov34/MPN/PAD-1 family protein [Niabella sp. W65]|nr:Mov34/MPN/PAD-1 family protein [Niabella sp. W65]MCH7365809.1 Mov34/MPN/PAD-1 family protein [Niabella sp. W65]ULT41565.1 Mov34/MPN/PAD-1 family protein [Niabella sp. I65]